MTFTKRPMPTWWYFLLKEFHTHRAVANQALTNGDKAKYLEEIEKANDALSDFQKLFNEFRHTLVRVE